MDIQYDKPMIQSFEYYLVDPISWKNVKKLNNVLSCTIKYDSTSETLGSATIDMTEYINDCYIRAYIAMSQNGHASKRPIGTFIVQTPSEEYDGLVRKVSMDAYTPLIELNDSSPLIGYNIRSGSNIIDTAVTLIKDNSRISVIPTTSDDRLYTSFVSEPDEKWLSFIKALLLNGKYQLDIDPMGNVLFKPKQDIEAMQSSWIYADDNSSIITSDISFEHDLYGIPNCVEVIYSSNNKNIYGMAINNDPYSLTSTVNRGRKIVFRDTDPKITTTPDQGIIQEYAEAKLKEMSSVDYSVTYTHGYCPVRVGDCVTLNYSRAGLNNVKAKVISQSIKCSTGCLVTEKAVFTANFWG